MRERAAALHGRSDSIQPRFSEAGHVAGQHDFLNIERADQIGKRRCPDNDRAFMTICVVLTSPASKADCT